MKKVLRFLAGAAIIGFGFFIAKALIGMKSAPPVKSPPKATRLVKIMPAVVDAETPVTYIQGRVTALDKIEVYSEVTGVILTGGKEFRPGTRFVKGEVMIQLDGRELAMSLVAQRSAFLQLLTGALADIKIDFPDRYEDWKQYTSELEVEEPLVPLPTSASDQEKFFLSNRGILNQFYAIRSAEERLNKYEIKAPFNGEVTTSMVNPGALVRASQKIGEFVNNNEFEIESAISGDALAVIRVGDLVALRAGNGRSFDGVIARISESIDPSTQSAKVFIHTKENGLRDGVYLTGEVRSSAIEDVTRVPLELLSPDNTLFTVVHDTLLKAVPVEVVYRSSQDALVRGLQPGIPLISESFAGAFDGMTVKSSRE